VSGVVEEAAFRDYMQRGLEPFGVERAVLATSLVFTLLRTSTNGTEKSLTYLLPGLHRLRSE
jgi:membrane protease YdiL (CAAX protease family)